MGKHKSDFYAKVFYEKPLDAIRPCPTSKKSPVVSNVYGFHNFVWYV